MLRRINDNINKKYEALDHFDFIVNNHQPQISIRHTTGCLSKSSTAVNGHQSLIPF